MKKISFENFSIGDNEDLVFIGGPCAIESLDHSLRIADQINLICEKLKLNWILNPATIKIVDPHQKVFME